MRRFISVAEENSGLTFSRNSSHPQGVRDRYEAARDISGTLESLVEHEARGFHRSGIPCLVRLMRYVLPLLSVLHPGSSSIIITIITISGLVGHPRQIALYSRHLRFPFFLFSSRGLALTCKALQNMQADTSCELHVCFKRSYDSVLRHHHPFLIRTVVSVSKFGRFM